MLDKEFCGTCHAEFIPTPAQARRVKNGKKIYCCDDCAQRAIHKTKDRAPWEFLGVPHVLDNLPEYVEQADVYVGY